MTKKFSNLLLGLLWLLTVTLATTFWMNIKYGFNIFSAAHWAYLSELQAYRTEIKMDFYISLIAAIIIGLTGLYLLARPKMRMFFIEPSQMPPPSTGVDTPNILHRPKTNKSITEPAPEQANNTAPRIAPQPNPARPISPMGTRQTVPTPNRATTAPHFNTPAPKITAPEPTAGPHIVEIGNIIENAGYIIKPCQRIGKLIKPVVALAYNQTVWVCAENVSVADMTDALQTIVTVFDDTLGDTANDMNVHGCIINTREPSNNQELISVFGTIDEFREFINTHPNTKPTDYDPDLFDAISTYIGTVTNYIGKQ